MYLACILHVSRTYPTHLSKAMLRYMLAFCIRMYLACIQTYLTSGAKIRPWSMYPARVMHVSCMYLMPFAKIHVPYVSRMYSVCILHAFRMYLSRCNRIRPFHMYPACIPHVSFMRLT